VRYVERSIEIDAPADAVWSVMRDGARWPEWTASVTSVEPLEDGPLAVGRRYRVKQPKFPAAVWEVTEVEEGRGFVWVSRSPGVRVFASHSVTPLGARTRATLSLRYEGPLGGILGWMTRGITLSYLDLEANGLKRESEARAASDA
jgi:uncharacterized membrane protein